MVDIENLIKMANRIGLFFEAMPDRGQATKDVAGHLKKFWDPRMRSELLAYVQKNGTEELKPIVQEALNLL